MCIFGFYTILSLFDYKHLFSLDEVVGFELVEVDTTGEVLGVKSVGVFALG